jgi:hypothetical protein
MEAASTMISTSLVARISGSALSVMWKPAAKNHFGSQWTKPFGNLSDHFKMD